MVWNLTKLNSLGHKKALSDQVSGFMSVLSRVRLCHPVDCSPPGSSVRGILQERTLEWVAIFFSNAWGAIAFSEGCLLQLIKY